MVCRLFAVQRLSKARRLSEEIRQVNFQKDSEIHSYHLA